MPQCLGQTQRPDQLHQVRVTSGTRHPWHKARDIRNSAKPQWKVEQKLRGGADNNCWTAHLAEAFQGSHMCEMFEQAVRSGGATFHE
eukprot:1156868-Pelagomonas_calceolata.AAC.2